MASLLQGGTGEVKVPAQSAPGPGWRRMGRAWRSRMLLPKSLCSPFPPKSSAWRLRAVMGIAEPQLGGALQVQIHTHMCAHIHIGGAGTYIRMIYYVHTPAAAAGAVPPPRTARPGLELLTPGLHRDHSSQQAAPAEPGAAKSPPSPRTAFSLVEQLPISSRAAADWPAGERWLRMGFLRPPLR